METMTTHERMTHVYDRREPDRVPIMDWAWESTIERWRAEGMPADMTWESYLKTDQIVIVNIDVGPDFDHKVVEETDTYIIERDHLGQTHRNFKPVNSTPEYIDSLVKDPETWKQVKERMTVSRDRVDWKYLEANFETWRKNGAWIAIAPYWGFDVISTRMCNSEMILYAMADNPGWVREMCDHGADVAVQLFDMIRAEGYEFDELFWCDDMAYRNGLLFSKQMWREIVMPYQKRLIDWAHANDAKAHLHCCGRVTELLPDLIELGLEGLDPMEVKAGMDPVKMKAEYGKDLLLYGGFDIRKWSEFAAAEKDIRALLPTMMEGSGYVFSSDHSIPQSVSLDAYSRIVALVKELGVYS